MLISQFKQAEPCIASSEIADRRPGFRFQISRAMHRRWWIALRVDEGDPQKCGSPERSAPPATTEISPGSTALHSCFAVSCLLRLYQITTFLDFLEIVACAGGPRVLVSQLTTKRPARRSSRLLKNHGLGSTRPYISRAFLKVPPRPPSGRRFAPVRAGASSG